MPTRFEPPALLDDFDRIPHQRDGWHAYMSNEFEGNIRGLEGELNGAHRPQFFNPAVETPPGLFDKPVSWPALPLTFVRRFGRRRAFELLDDPQPDPGIGNITSRLQDEYCEWQVTRDALTQKILRVTFTCEGPEYWQSIAGGPSIYNRAGERPADFGAVGDRNVLVQLYREILGRNDIAVEDLFFSDQPDTYNPWNRWNTTDGIVHLQQINNTLGAEINIGARATILRAKGGRPVEDATRLICCSGYGGAERASDPSLGHEINQGATTGALLALKSPVGIYMDRIDDSGFTKPGPNNSRVPVGDYWRPLRPRPALGSPLVVRAVYEVPPGEVHPDTGVQLTVSDLEIGGVPITTGSQLSEFIMMKFIALVSAPSQVNPVRLDCLSKCCRKNGILAVSRLSDSCADVFPVSPTPAPLAMASLREAFGGLTNVGRERT